MTVEDIRSDLEQVYTTVLRQQKEVRGVRAGQQIPEGVTPLLWHAELPASVVDMTREDFRAQHVADVVVKIAEDGLAYGCNRFSKLTVEDRPTAEVKGHTKTHRRARAFIVKALGWKG